jgi:hypothetical protein
MSYLEQAIASRGLRRRGGHHPAPPSIPHKGGGDPGGEVLELMRKFVAGQAEFRAELSGWQREFEMKMDLLQAGG